MALGRRSTTVTMHRWQVDQSGRGTKQPACRGVNSRLNAFCMNDLRRRGGSRHEVRCQVGSHESGGRHSLLSSRLPTSVPPPSRPNQPIRVSVRLLRLPTEQPGANARRLIADSFPGSAWECGASRLRRARLRVRWVVVWRVSRGGASEREMYQISRRALAAGCYDH